jgi:hypothetical protein
MDSHEGGRHKRTLPRVRRGGRSQLGVVVLVAEDLVGEVRVGARSFRRHGHTDTGTKASVTTTKHIHERVPGSQLASCRNYIEHPPSIERGRCHRRKRRAPAVGLDEEQRGRECGKCSSPRRPEVVRLGRRPATTLRTGGGDE